MSKLTIIYESRYGQTRKIADYVATLARRRGHTVALVSIGEVDVRRLGEADAYTILAPVYRGKHPPATKELVKKHGDVLNARPSMFISVSNAAASTREEERRGAREQATRFLADTPWRPNLVRIAGGALAYPSYGLFTRFIMKRIARREGRPTDTSRTHELTSWGDIDRMTFDLLALIAPKAGVPVETESAPLRGFGASP